MLWKKKKKQESAIVLGMVLLADESSFVLDDFILDYNKHFGNVVNDLTGDNFTAAFSIDGKMVAIAHMPVPVPAGDIKQTAECAYNWVTAWDDVKDHKSHLIVTIMEDGGLPTNRFKLFTQVISSLLRTTNAIGVYLGSQSLLIPRTEYLEESILMSNEYLPLNLWIYFGLRIQGSGNYGYTYGLVEFGKTEMEIVDSTKSIEDIRALLFNMSHYVLDYDVVFKHGETCGLSEEEKIPISYSKGLFVDGKTFKLGY